MLVKNRIYTATIEDYTAQGQGVARVEGCARLRPRRHCWGGVPDPDHQGGQNLGRRGNRVHQPGVPPPDQPPMSPGQAVRGLCLPHMDYAEECRLKRERVRQALNRLAGENLAQVPLLPAPSLTAYRNKAQYPVAPGPHGPVAGFFQAGTHRVIAAPRCAILPRRWIRCGIWWWRTWPVFPRQRL